MAPKFALRWTFAVAVAMVIAACGGSSETSESTGSTTAPRVKNAAGVPANTGLPRTSAQSSGVTTRVGDTVTVTSNGTWSNSPTSYSYQWQRGTHITDAYFADISGATNDSYPVTAADLGFRLRVKVTAANATGPSATAAASIYSNTTVRVLPELVAGTGGLSGSVNGPSLTARFVDMRDITADADGNLYVSDYGDYTIRKISVDGVVSVLAGSAGVSGTSDGAGGAARFSAPSAIEFNSFSNSLFVDDGGTIREVALDGTVTTVKVRLAVSSVSSSGTTRTVTIPVAPFAPSSVVVELDEPTYKPKFDGTYTVSASSATTFNYTVSGSSYTLANTATTGTVTGTLGASFKTYPNNMNVDPSTGDVWIARANEGQNYTMHHVYKISRISGSTFSITKAINSTGFMLVGLARIDSTRFALIDGAYFYGFLYNTATSSSSSSQTWATIGGIPYSPTYAPDGYLYGSRNGWIARNSVPGDAVTLSGVIAGGATDWNGGALQNSYPSSALYGEFLYVADKWAIYRVNIGTTSAKPGAPSIASTSVGDTQVTVTVGTPLGGGVPTRYDVTATPGGATCQINSPATSCAVTGLSNGTSYSFVATATNSAGTSNGSVAASNTPNVAPGVPGKPSAVAGDGQATVTVNPPLTGGGPATYTVTANPGGATCSITVPSLSCDVTGLSNATAYTFSSTATNSAGTSSASSPSDAVTPRNAPGVPGKPTAVAGDAQATVTIVPPLTGGAPDTYLVTASPGGATCTVTVPATSCDITGLTNAIAHTFWSTATNASGTSAASTSSDPITPTLAAPGVPGRPAALAGDGKATVTIVPPLTGGAPDTYLVTASPGGATCTVTAPASSCLITGLVNDTAYTFSSTATNAAGTSSGSVASVSVTPSLAAPGTPGQPTVLSGDGRVTVTVATPGSGGAPATYTVTASPGGATCTVTVPATSCDVTGLTNATAYTFTVTATNASGTSTASVASQSVQPVLAAPGTPSQPTVVVGDGRATVTVVPASGGAPDTYLVTASPGGATCTVTAPATSCVVTGLTNSTPYTFSVTATNAAGTSSASTASAAATPAPGVSSTVTTVSVGSVSINSGAAYATATRVKLTLVVPTNAAKMRVSNDGGFTGITAVDASTSVDHDLVASTSSVSRTVYVVFLDASGNALGQIYTDDIVLDTSKPSITADMIVAGPRATINPVFQDDSGIETWFVTSDTSTPGSPIEPSVLSRSVEARVGQTLYVRVVDKAGNSSEWLELKVGTGSVDGDKLTAVDDTATLQGTSGLIVMTDGSSMEFTKNGQLKIRLRTGYIGYASGSVTAKYSVAGRSATYKCAVSRFKVGKVDKRATKPVNGWFPRKFWSPNKPCDLPKELTDAMKSNSITFRGKLKFTRFWPTTGKKINPETNEVIKPIVRRLRINVGVVAL